MIDLSQFSCIGLLALHAGAADALRDRGITRTLNNPTGDLAEYLFCKAFDWNQNANSNPNFDATDSVGNRYQIKGRRSTRRNKSRQLSTIRDIDGEHFDYLAGVIFHEDYSVMRAAIIPRTVILNSAVFIPRTNSHRFLLRDQVWNEPNVRDVTTKLRAVML